MFLGKSKKTNVKKKTSMDKTKNNNPKVVKENKKIDDKEKNIAANITNDINIENTDDMSYDFVSNKEKKKKKRSFLITSFLTILVLLSIVLLIFNVFKTKSISSVISSFIILLFSLIFTSIISTNQTSKKGTKFFAIVLLIIYLGYNSFNNFDIKSFSNNKVMKDLVGLSLTDAMKWSSSNNIELNQIYEYSDLVNEYLVISQDVKAGSKLNGVTNVTISISEGPNPYKDVVVPNMIDWDVDRVLAFIEENHLTNVNVEFVSSDKLENTVISQSKSGNLKRNDEINLVFSYGEERRYDEVKLQDLTDMSEFRAIFYLKQYGIKYDVSRDFSKDIKRGNIMKQSIKAGTVVKINSEDEKTLIITVSKGCEIKVPDLTKYSIDEITDWIIKNKLKVEFNDKYDDSVKINSVIDASYKEGDIIEEGSLVTITLSKGKIAMKEFTSFNDFREWSEKYGIAYEEQHEFSDSVEAGKVISYSYNSGDTIKNGDTIIVTISDGRKISVPNVKGINKDSVINKLKKANLNYSFVYKYSDSVAEGISINQSISPGSDVCEGTTITVTISKGKAPANNNNNNNNGGNTNQCVPTTYSITRDLNNIFMNYSGFDSVKGALQSFFASNYPGVKINVVGVSDTGMSSGSYVGGIGPGSTITSCNSSAYVIQIAQ